VAVDDDRSALAEALTTRALPGAMLGDFQLLELIGRGGMAEVWRAAWRIGSAVQVVALKRTLPEIAARRDLAGLFLDELQCAVRLRHPHIVRSFHAGEVQGQPLLAMEFLDGVDLRTLMRTAPRALPMAFAIHVACAVADALAYIRSLRDEQGRALNMVHRDVSPSNVMICRDGSIKLLDFGIAKALGQRSYDVTRFVKGKWGYMAPEMIRSGRYDHRVDVYGVGAVLYELLAHRRLRTGIPERQRSPATAPVPPSTVNPAVPVRLDAIVLRALADDPNQRYTTADALKRDLCELQPEVAWTSAHTRALLARVTKLPVPEERVEAATRPANVLTETSTTPASVEPAEVSPAHEAASPSTGALALVAAPADERTASSVCSPKSTFGRRAEQWRRYSRGARTASRGLVAVALGALMLGFVIGLLASSYPAAASTPHAAPPSRSQPLPVEHFSTGPRPVAVDPSTALADDDARPSWLARAVDQAVADPVPATSPRPTASHAPRRPSHGNRSLPRRLDLEGGWLVSPYPSRGLP